MKKGEVQRVAQSLLRALHAVPEKDRAAAVPVFVEELKRLNKIPNPKIFSQVLEQAWSSVFGAQTVCLTTAHRVPATLKEQLAETFPNLELKSVIDPRLMGGATLRMDDRIIDGSLLGKLERMKKAFLAQ